MRIAIIGAGPAGVVAAYELAKKGYKPDLYESSKYIGGLARSFQLWGQTVDLGPHRFSSADPRITQIWKETIERDIGIVTRLTRIFFRHKFFVYPLNISNALSNLGNFEAGLCVASYLRQKINPTKDDGTFETWVVRRYGKRLFRTFFKTYSEKFWGISCMELDADFASQRIKKFSLREAIRASRKKKNDALKRVEQFFYPKRGAGLPYERMVERMVNMGGSYFPETSIQKLIVENSNVVGIQAMTGEQIKYDHTICAMPLDLLINGLDNAPEKIRGETTKLKFRNTIIVYLQIEGSGHFPDNWLYIHSAEFKMGRITNFRNWTPEINGSSQNTILALEYWCFERDALWREDDAKLVALATKEIQASGLVGEAKVISGHVARVSRSYPVFSTGYKFHLEPIVQYLKTVGNLQVVGRYGSFKFNNQDQSILMGILAAENITEGKNHDLWELYTEHGTSSQVGDTDYVFEVDNESFTGTGVQILKPDE